MGEEFLTFYQQNLVYQLTLMHRIATNGLEINEIYKQMQKVYDGMINKDTGEHLIQGVKFSGVKTSLIERYVTALVQEFDKRRGITLKRMTHESIFEGNQNVKAMINSVSTKLFNSHKEIFALFFNYLFGVDNNLINYALTPFIEENLKPKFLSMIKTLIGFEELIDDIDYLADNTSKESINYYLINYKEFNNSVLKKILQLPYHDEKTTLMQLIIRVLNQKQDETRELKQSI